MNFGVGRHYLLGPDYQKVSSITFLVRPRCASCDLLVMDSLVADLFAIFPTHSYLALQSLRFVFLTDCNIVALRLLAPFLYMPFGKEEKDV